jgi:hypothetical protein
MIQKQIMMNSSDLEKICEIVKENSLANFKLIQENSSGIGYTTDLEFETSIYGRTATVTISVVDSDTW